MCKSSTPKYFKYLILTLFLSFVIFPGYSNKIQTKDSIVNKQRTLQPGDSINNKNKTPLPGDSLSNKNKAIQPGDSILNENRIFDAEDLIRGERLFYGLAYTKEKSINCTACHNTRQSDTLNWNPDAVEISNKYFNKSAVDLNKILLKPSGKKMSQTHKGFNFKPEDVMLIKAYMNKIAGMGLKQDRLVITNLLLLIIASILFLISTADLIIKKIFKKPWINWAIISTAGISITYILAVNAIAFGRATGFSPAQPIKFSHAVHAGQNKTDCNYCHYSAKVSKSSGIPPGNVCMNCHFLVRNGTRSGATEIAKVLSAFDNRKAVEWIRIYNLPDFVFFSHAQHVTAGGIKCETCHGDVKKIDRLYQVSDLSMGWCLDCHDTRKINLSNEYYKTYYSGFYDSLKAGKIDSVTVAGIGGRDCGKCHY